MHELYPKVGDEMRYARQDLRVWQDRGWLAGTEVDKDGCEFELMTENEREQLAYLIELRDMIRAELIEYGQIEA